MSMNDLQVSLDNGLNWMSVNGIRIRAADPDVDNEVHYNVTHEGVITDIVCDGSVVGTDSRTHFDAIEDLE